MALYWGRKRIQHPMQYLQPPKVSSQVSSPKLYNPPSKPSLNTTFSDDEDSIKESVKAEVFNVSADIPLHDTSLLNNPTSVPMPTPQFSTPTKSSVMLVAHSTPRSGLGQQQCASLTRAGFKCRLPATPGLSYCRRHAQ